MSPPAAATLELSTLADCGLAISGYPRFRYDARGGGGSGRLGQPAGDGSRPLRFQPDGLRIPPLDWRSTRVLGVPLPPGLSIGIEAEQLEGVLDPASGSLALNFRARFLFRLGSLYSAPPLLVTTELVTGDISSQRHRRRGQPLDSDGLALLVGVATIQPSGEPWLDRVLGLPDEALALLRCRFTPEPGAGFPWEPPAGRSAPGQSAPA
ncbi:hypothetical protein I1E95_08965 [Synechococcus sp. CBW1107]|uniref:hypothetical protein n=1 Tax=Synechococcus sp. CBW1107 TaxID=2789857 RepID=UPI0018CE5C19|nr:hypothetical protein [Synechococcus sp. CBW1107]QPN55372.1 hypothetical protein I1E95_08965 [Synechococcus sp. CBW1107]CAK6689286.1 hypothetical protein BBFGKLBO_00587 [Synechococcus sp. CBW1107]